MKTETLIENKDALWGHGPWVTEPDRAEWTSEAGLPCIALRQHATGHWCGYVAVAPGHPWHGKDWNGIDDVSVHGGITYGEACAGRVCHVTSPGEPDDVWWIGFDCAHAYDLVPANLAGGFRCREDIYRPLHYVQAECESLARQAKAAERASLGPQNIDADGRPVETP